MTCAASTSTYGTVQTWHRGQYPLEVALERAAEAVDAREEAAREVVAEVELDRTEAPATQWEGIW